MYKTNSEVILIEIIYILKCNNSILFIVFLNLSYAHKKDAFNLFLYDFIAKKAKNTIFAIKSLKY